MRTSMPDGPIEAVALAEPRLAVPGLRLPVGQRVGRLKQQSGASATVVSPVRPAAAAEALDASA